MSDLRIALVAEGPTDYEVIHAALRAVLSRPFNLTLLQPEATLPIMGSGWGGVLKWCHAARQRHAGTLDSDPTLAGFDLLIIHLDVQETGPGIPPAGPADHGAMGHSQADLHSGSVLRAIPAGEHKHMTIGGRFLDCSLPTQQSIELCKGLYA